MKTSNRLQRKLRLKSSIRGSHDRPRLSVFRSNKHIYAQIIDDESSKTLASTSDLKIKDIKGKKAVDIAFIVGEELGKLAKTKKIEKVVLDRNGYKYHGQVKSLAEGARKAGLLF